MTIGILLVDKLRILNLDNNESGKRYNLDYIVYFE